MEILRGDVWIVNLDPAFGHEINKTRPAVIIQNNLGNKYSPTTIIAPITSQINAIYPVEIFIKKQDACLDKDSKVLLHQIRTVDKRRLVKKLGKLDEETANKVDKAIKVSLGLIKI